MTQEIYLSSMLIVEMTPQGPQNSERVMATLKWACLQYGTVNQEFRSHRTKRFLLTNFFI